MMGRVSGDKARFNRRRRHKLARRATMRALAGARDANDPISGTKTAHDSGRSSDNVAAKRD